MLTRPGSIRNGTYVCPDWGDWRAVSFSPTRPHLPKKVAHCGPRRTDSNTVRQSRSNT
jgi:hypothetical protein